MGQFSVETYSAPGSHLSGNQQIHNHEWRAMSREGTQGQTICEGAQRS